MNFSSERSLDPVTILGARVLATRDQGKKLRELAIGRLRQPGVLEVSLERVEAVSPSFADEFFGGLMEELGRDEFLRRIRVGNASEEIRLLIRKVVSHREQSPHTKRSGSD
ncbi:MAG: STAS-like domain-containing protein [Candidatus Eisenbacteria bacterium]|nr:STAS-like domain-containing protein [Candidatus Eisenbacteria bacterium]